MPVLQGSEAVVPDADSFTFAFRPGAQPGIFGRTGIAIGLAITPAYRSVVHGTYGLWIDLACIDAGAGFFFFTTSGRQQAYGDEPYDFHDSSLCLKQSMV